MGVSCRVSGAGCPRLPPPDPRDPMMIERYTRPEMGAIWTDENRFQKWLDVEIAACEVHAEMGTIPAGAVEVIKQRARFDVARINEIERTTRHDVIAFTTAL